MDGVEHAVAHPDDVPRETAFGERCGNLLEVYEQHRKRIHREFWDSTRIELGQANIRLLEQIPELSMQNTCDEVGIPGKATLADALRSGTMNLLRFQCLMLRYSFTYSLELIEKPTMDAVRLLRQRAGEHPPLLTLQTYRLVRMAMSAPELLFGKHQSDPAHRHDFCGRLASHADLPFPPSFDAELLAWGPPFLTIHSQMLTDWEENLEAPADDS